MPALRPMPCGRAVVRGPAGAGGWAQTPDHLKTQTCDEAFNPNGLAQRSIAILKDTFPDIEVRRWSATAGPIWHHHSDGY